MNTVYYGKYRGKVTNVNDPKGAGRIKAQVPSITGDYETGWCLPCLPSIGSGHGVIFLPNVGDLVWVEFERGNLNFPIWTGCWLPTARRAVGNAIIKTADGTIHIRDGEIWLTNANGDSISVSYVLDEFKAVRDEFKKADDSLKSWANGRFELK